jgi:hypothetical protein
MLHNSFFLAQKLKDTKIKFFLTNFLDMLFHYAILKSNNSTTNSVLPNLMEIFGTLYLVSLRA